MGAGAFLLRPKLLFVSRGELLLGREEGKGLGLPIPIGPIKERELLRGSILPSRRAALLYVIVVCHVVSFPLHRRVPMHYVPVH